MEHQASLLLRPTRHASVCSWPCTPLMLAPSHPTPFHPLPRGPSVAAPHSAPLWSPLPCPPACWADPFAARSHGLLLPRRPPQARRINGGRCCPTAPLWQGGLRVAGRPWELVAAGGWKESRETVHGVFGAWVPEAWARVVEVGVKARFPCQAPAETGMSWRFVIRITVGVQFARTLARIRCGRTRQGKCVNTLRLGCVRFPLSCVVWR